MGGYNGTAVTVEYADMIFGSFKRELLAEIGKPDLHLGYDAPLEGPDALQSAQEITKFLYTIEFLSITCIILFCCINVSNG